MNERPRATSLQARQLAATVALPEWARQFTDAGMAVLAVIRDGATERCPGTRNSMCSLTVRDIAERAGVSVTATYRTISQAYGLGVVDRFHRAVVNRYIGRWS